MPVRKWTWTPHDPAAAGLRPSDTPPPLPNSVQTNYRPSRRRRKVVLVFQAGVESEGLIEALRAEGLEFFFLDYLEFMERGSVVMSAASPETSELRFGPARLLLRDVAAVVWKQPLAVASRISKRPPARHLYLHRWTQVLRDLAGLLPEETLWLPAHPLQGSNDFQEKLSDLIQARSVGLKVPETLCTNDPKIAAAFIRRHRGRVLFRDFSKTQIRFRTAFADTDPRRLARLRNSPCVFQRYVEKEHDARAVLIGGRVFACRIDSQASEAARVDWRVYDNRNVRWDRMRLPRRVERRLLLLMKRIGIAWGSVDLVKGKDGFFYFLEANRPGVTYWLLPFVGLDVPREIARFLKTKLARR
ncbi:MAG TPA: hypothetical protein VKJ00_13885 [Thermoanaerobaculia bacterium]|nr:hypothetical protein [Thermoanaerobaculia bacterium]